MTDPLITEEARAEAYIKAPYEGLFDRRGEPFILHPMGVRDIAVRAWDNPPPEAAEVIAELKRRGVTRDQIAAIALLHDILELHAADKPRHHDDDLRRSRFSKFTVSVVKLLSEKWNPSQNLNRRLRQQYNKLRGTSTEALTARFIKQCDLAHNLLPERLRPVEGHAMTWESSAQQIFKYFIATTRFFEHKPIGMPNGIDDLRVRAPDVYANFHLRLDSLLHRYRSGRFGTEVATLTEPGDDGAMPAVGIVI